MDTQITTQQYIATAVQSYVPVVVGENPITIDEHLKSVAQVCSGITIAGLNDKKGYDRAKTALSKVKKIRTAVEAKRKELKQVALDYGKAVDGEAKRITALVQPIEDDLAGKIKAIDDAAEIARKAEQTRRHALLLDSGFGCFGGMYTAGIYNYSTEQVMAADEATLADIVAKGVAERDRAKAEAERLQREREELEAERKRLADERANLEAEVLAAAQADIEEKKKAGLIADGKAEIIDGKVQVSVVPVTAPKEITVNITPEVIEPAHTIQNVLDELPNSFAQHDLPDGVAIAQAPQVQRYSTADEKRILLAYQQGFDKAKELLLARLNDPAPITRADLKLFVSSLTFKGGN